MPPPPGLGFTPHPTSFGFSGFRAPPPSGTAGSSTPHQPISQASSSDEEEQTNDTDVVQHLGFGHHVGKKTTRDVYGPYFTGVVRKSWTLRTTQMISYDELLRKILKYRDMDPNLWNVRMTMKGPSYYEVHRMFYFNLYSMNNDEEMHYLRTIPPHLAKEGIHILVEFEHIQNITTLPEHIIVVTQMVSDEPSMFSARYDYTHSGAFLYMGSGSPIDDIVESGTVRLLDWNDSKTDIQLGMRFVDKVQAISAIRKWSISVGREYRVLKSKIDTWTVRCYHHSGDNYCSWYIRIKKKAMHN
ncbi:hypothetical protein M9H77_35734 [Catharanthus roseus]|uniref:Uncharacterized protein n=1 Tax=Catharanthus roseus TaxID=4058 RepID=A0ACB9ZPV1_CATRO|nr:hypothetical protein M9H77_35734 [Catharanthus roseus]